MSNPDQQFQQFIKDIITSGSEIDTRNSITKRRMNQIVTFNSTPLICSRKTAWKSALREMKWFLSGSSNIKDLHSSVHKWWKPWVDEDGNVPNNYSEQFREFWGSGNEPVDQIEFMIKAIKEHPFSRRNLITTWNTADMLSEETPITNCHGTTIQSFVEPDNTLHLTMYQRSCDMLLGVPHNWIQYWALLTWLAHKGGRDVGSFTWIGGDCHVYKDHYEYASKFIETDVSEVDTPQLIYTPSGEEFKAEDFKLDREYQPIFQESLKMVV